MDETKMKKLSELISNHLTAKIVYATTDPTTGQPSQSMINGAQFTEDLDGNLVITLW